MLDAPPVSGPAGTGQVAAILLQDTQGLDQSSQRVQDLKQKQMWSDSDAIGVTALYQH